MKFSRIAVLLIISVLALAVPASASDAVLTVTDTGSGDSFDTFNGGSLHFTISNSGSACTADITVKNGSQTVAESKAYPIAGEGTTEVRIDMKNFTREGTYNLDIYCVSNDSGNPFDESGHFSRNITVEKNVLSNWTTYVVIIVAIIAVAIIVYIKMRETPKKKSDMTFEQLEAERQAKAAKKKTSSTEPAPSTERKRYVDRKKKE
ncbi:MAG: hypothetical protein J5494_02965 [Candidatus Methanomethylophilaceae archaeon]|nr:hypothetical protein [Candidatus Methanomethylophilaceae archaeon]